MTARREGDHDEGDERVAKETHERQRRPRTDAALALDARQQGGGEIVPWRRRYSRG
jgi:hypothetical protein